MPRLHEAIEVVGVALDVVCWLHTPSLHWTPGLQHVQPQQVAPGTQHPVRTLGQQTALDTRETRYSKSSIWDMGFPESRVMTATRDKGIREEMSKFPQILEEPTLTQVRNKLALHIAGRRMANT